MAYPYPTLNQDNDYPLSMPWADIVDAWLVEGNKRWTSHVYAQYESISKEFIRWLGPNIPTPARINQYQDHLVAIGKHTPKKLSVIREAYRFAIRSGFAARNPFAAFRCLPTPRERKRIKRLVPYDDWLKIANFMAYKRISYYAVWVGCYETGMAACDVASLEWAHIDRKTWIIKRIRRKMERRRSGGEMTTAVDPNGRFYKAIKQQAELLRAKGSDATEEEKTYVFPRLQRAISKKPGRLTIELKDFLTNNNLPIYTFHDLRRTKITTMVAAGIPTKLIQLAVGHSNPEMVARYTGTTEDQIRQAIIEANRVSRLCLQSPSAPTVSPTSFDSASEHAERSLETPPSSSPTTDPNSQDELGEWLKKRTLRSSPPSGDAPIAPETGRPSLLPANGDELLGPPSASSSPSGSSPSEDWLA